MPMTATDTVRWRGVHHLALITPDMDATVRFWHGVIGARLVTTLAVPAFKHYFFEVSPGNTIAFFEYADAHLNTYAKPAGVPVRAGLAVRSPVAAPGGRGRAARAAQPAQEPRL